MSEDMDALWRPWLQGDHLGLAKLINAARRAHPKAWPPDNEWHAKFRDLKAAIDGRQLMANKRGDRAHMQSDVVLRDLWRFYQKYPSPIRSWIPGFCEHWAAVCRFDLPQPARNTVGAQTECRQWLVGLMEEHETPPEKKEVYREQAQQLFRVGPRPFDKAWAEAIRHTGSTRWSRRGPKSKRDSNHE
jgi:hypothetical protein